MIITPKTGITQQNMHQLHFDIEFLIVKAPR